jgi:hypothetical protein
MGSIKLHHFLSLLRKNPRIPPNATSTVGNPPCGLSIITSKSKPSAHLDVCITYRILIPRVILSILDLKLKSTVH